MDRSRSKGWKKTATSPSPAFHLGFPLALDPIPIGLRRQWRNNVAASGGNKFKLLPSRVSRNETEVRRPSPSPLPSSPSTVPVTGAGPRSSILVRPGAFCHPISVKRRDFSTSRADYESVLGCCRETGDQGLSGTAGGTWGRLWRVRASSRLSRMTAGIIIPYTRIGIHAHL